MSATPLADNEIFAGDNLTVMSELPAGSFQLVYMDPPFNTGTTRRHANTRVTQVDGSSSSDERLPANPSTTGFGGRRYTRVEVGPSRSYEDDYDDFLGFIEPRLMEAWRVLHDTGTMYVHLDAREVHHVKVRCDALFGRDHFLNEIIWAYDYGGRPRRRWPAKHDTILVYVKDPDRYWFDNAAVEREPYLAPGLVTEEQRARGKLPTDVWWHTIVSPTGKEKTGYPTQKPEGILRRIVSASSRPGDWVLDPFAGSGTTGAVAAALGRRYVMIDRNPEAIAVMEARLGRSAVRRGIPRR